MLCMYICVHFGGSSAQVGKIRKTQVIYIYMLFSRVTGNHLETSKIRCEDLLNQTIDITKERHRRLQDHSGRHERKNRHESLQKLLQLRAFVSECNRHLAE